MPWTTQTQNALEPLPPVPAVAPLFSFDDINEYERRQLEGISKEFQFEMREIAKFNKEELNFKAFPMITMRRGRNTRDILLFVEPRERDSMLPKEDESCKINIPRFGLMNAKRKENPCSSWGVRGHHWDRYMVFEVTLEISSRDSFNTFFSGPELIETGMEMPQPHRIQSRNITFELRLSFSTMEAERDAVKAMVGAVRGDPEGTQAKARAFKYIMDFRTVTSWRNIFSHFPHMASPTSLPQHVSSQLARKMESLNSHQKQAYTFLLRNIPEGVTILSGGPGAGKTHFITVLVAALQSTDEMLFLGETVPRHHRNTTLVLCDINKPATDIANKFHGFYSQLRLVRYEPGNDQPIPRVVVRMHCWSYEKKSVYRRQLQAEEEELLRRVSRGDQNPMSGARGFAGGRGIANSSSANDERELVDVHRFSLPFLRASSSVPGNMLDWQQGRVAPTLDQFARADYQRYRDTQYSRLRNMLSSVNTEDVDATTIISFSVEKEIEKVYRNALRKIDVLVTTPVTAMKFSSALANIFNPTLVIFDEAPHAREASTLIPIAKFNPLAWIYTGDHRQTKPWVETLNKRPNVNRYAPQLRVSMMERAYRLNPEAHALMINHRAYGNLHELPSTLFYDGRMISAYGEGQGGPVPPSASHLRASYIMPMKRNSGPPVSRLLIVLPSAGPPVNMQESWYHPRHEQWVRSLVIKLLRDRQFKQADRPGRGTILIMAPYKAASIEYRKLIKELRYGFYPRLDTTGVEARTIDTAQGHEADFVILDLVRDKVTDHLDDRNRLCVALTRARQAEVILMHENLLRQLRGNSSFSNGTLAAVVSHCERAGELVVGPASLV